MSPTVHPCVRYKLSPMCQAAHANHPSSDLRTVRASPYANTHVRMYSSNIRGFTETLRGEWHSELFSIAEWHRRFRF